MLKKIIILSIVTAVVLIGVENLIAQEQTDTPQQEPRPRRMQGPRQGQRGRIERPRGQQAENEAQAKLAEAMRMKRRQEALKKEKQQEAARKKAEVMRMKRQQGTAQEGAPQGRMGRSQQSRPARNKPMQQMFGGRGRGFQGRGMGGWNRRYQCEGLCPCCQRGMCPWYEGFSGRGMMGQGGRGFQGRGMMGRGGPGFRGRGMMGRG
ncbi:MAG: hypothetical protein HQ580_10175, partial [Planctomycetes bacterium]|nr:hypothetical protein [Planctomycetota bacterium]